jgi:hypothetical protein
MPDGRILSGKGRSPDAGRQRFSDDALKTMARLVGLKPLDQRLRPRLPKLDVDSLKAPPDTPPLVSARVLGNAQAVRSPDRSERRSHGGCGSPAGDRLY